MTRLILDCASASANTEGQPIGAGRPGDQIVQSISLRARSPTNTSWRSQRLRLTDSRGVPAWRSGPA